MKFIDLSRQGNDRFLCVNDVVESARLFNKHLGTLSCPNLTVQEVLTLEKMDNLLIGLNTEQNCELEKIDNWVSDGDTLPSLIEDLAFNMRSDVTPSLLFHYYKRGETLHFSLRGNFHSNGFAPYIRVFKIAKL